MCSKEISNVAELRCTLHHNIYNTFLVPLCACTSVILDLIVLFTVGNFFHCPTTSGRYVCLYNVCTCVCVHVRICVCTCVYVYVRAFILLMYIVVLVEKVHQITVDTSHGAVIACDVVGPYGVLLLQEGVGLLKLHEEQGEQLLEAGMSLRDEQSFMGDDNTKGSILTLEWPTLEQVRMYHHARPTIMYISQILTLILTDM